MSTVGQKSAGEGGTTGDLREQVGAQCNAVNHLATAIAQLYGDYAKIFHDGSAERLLEQVGKRTAAFMETLGDMLNATDSYSEDDDWLEPVFKEAQRRWPQPEPVNTPAELIEALKETEKYLVADANSKSEGAPSEQVRLLVRVRKAIALAERGA